MSTQFMPKTLPHIHISRRTRRKARRIAKSPIARALAALLPAIVASVFAMRRIRRGSAQTAS